jgi:hypothetical protein
MKNMHSIPVTVLLAAGLLAASTASAQALIDPTRPANMSMAPYGAGSAAHRAPEEQPAPVASIVVAGPMREFAVVDGQMVRVGQTYNGLRLKSVSIKGAVWDKPAAPKRGPASSAAARSAPNVSRTAVPGR